MMGSGITETQRQLPAHDEHRAQAEQELRTRLYRAEDARTGEPRDLRELSDVVRQARDDVAGPKVIVEVVVLLHQLAEDIVADVALEPRVHHRPRRRVEPRDEVAHEDQREDQHYLADVRVGVAGLEHLRDAVDDQTEDQRVRDRHGGRHEREERQEDQDVPVRTPVAPEPLDVRLERQLGRTLLRRWRIVRRSPTTGRSGLALPGIEVHALAVQFVPLYVALAFAHATS